jgi:hypothetical protein
VRRLRLSPTRDAHAEAKWRIEAYEQVCEQLCEAWEGVNDASVPGWHENFSPPERQGRNGLTGPLPPRTGRRHSKQRRHTIMQIHYAPW